MTFVSALNALHINVWGILLIGFGVVMVLLNHEHLGEIVITGGFALVQSNGVNAKEQKDATIPKQTT